MATFGITALIDAYIADTNIRFVCKCVRGKKLISENDRFPRLVFELVGISEEFEGVKQLDPAMIQLDAHVMRLHFWGEDEEDCQRIRQAFVKSFREYVQGRNYTLGAAEWAEPLFGNAGVVLTQLVTVQMPLPDATLPTSSAATPPTAKPSTTVINRVRPTVTVATVSPKDNTVPTAGDGILESGEG